MTVHSELLAFEPTDPTNRDEDLKKTLDGMANKIPKNPPAFVKIAPQDSGAGLLYQFYERMYIYTSVDGH